MIEICAAHSALTAYLASLVPVSLSNQLHAFIQIISKLQNSINEELKDLSYETLWQNG
jgi:hypothetical protein